mmetsp:Transcript_18603/g.42488  ORF Transcript_18603/g.42488 Transcript_18603/m.42488 type:complete len:212 (-) Transcript_18603:353-988(-)
MRTSLLTLPTGLLRRTWARLGLPVLLLLLDSSLSGGKPRMAPVRSSIFTPATGGKREKERGGDPSKAGVWTGESEARERTRVTVSYSSRVGGWRKERESIVELREVNCSKTFHLLLPARPLPLHTLSIPCSSSSASPFPSSSLCCVNSHETVTTCSRSLSTAAQVPLIVPVDSSMCRPEGRGGCTRNLSSTGRSAGGEAGGSLTALPLTRA